MLERVRAGLADQLGIEKSEITRESSFESLGADSLDLFEMVMELEDELNLEISTDDLEGMKIVGDLIAYLELNV